MFSFQLPFVPDLLSLYQLNPKRYPFLLERSSPSHHSRYSLLFAFPEKKLQIEFNSDKNFTELFDDWFNAERIPDLEKNDFPFTGGWFVYLGYELAAQIEPVLDLNPDIFNLPIAIATRVKTVIIIDHHKNECWFVSERKNQLELKQVQQDLEKIKAMVINAISIELEEDESLSYLDGVAKISEYIKAGDVFQVNLSRAWQGTVSNPISAADIYANLRQSNPAPFSALAHFDDFDIISSSPERLVRVDQGVIETRPIAGTRPRNDDPKKDEALLQELIQHPKERAEHIMLIDLERNDMGRICIPGSMSVNELMSIETYEHVHHIVSNIRGELQKDISPGAIIEAVFPGGTITGCPKVRCMEIIAELEQVGRGAYTGSLGYVNHSGDLDFNILIRTIVKQGQQLNFRTGAGIVFDSIPNHELEETRHKAKGLLKALVRDI